MRPLTASWIVVVIILAVLNGIRALPAGSRARRFMRNMGVAAAVLGSLAIVALKSGSQNANSPSTPGAQQGTETSTSIVVPDDTIAVQGRLIDLGYMTGTPDGLWGNKSRQALRAFKAANGIRVVISGTPKLARNSFRRRRLGHRLGRREAAWGISLHGSILRLCAATNGHEDRDDAVAQ